MTGPGKARDVGNFFPLYILLVDIFVQYVQKSSPPTRGNAVPRWWDSGSDLIGEPYIPVPQPEAHDTLEEGQDHSGSIGDATTSSSPTREKRRQTQREPNFS